MFKPGDVVLAKVQFTDTFEVKQRPAVVLFEELGNVVVAGVTSNTKMRGIALGKEDGMAKDSVIKLNYLFTISEDAVLRVLAKLNPKKKKEVYDGLCRRLDAIKG